LQNFYTRVAPTALKILTSRKHNPISKQRFGRKIFLIGCVP
jgi:hypothetical protein